MVGEPSVRMAKPPLNVPATSPMTVAITTATRAKSPRVAAKRRAGGLANLNVVSTTTGMATTMGKRTNATCLGGGDQRISRRAATTANPVMRGEKR